MATDALAIKPFTKPADVIKLLFSSLCSRKMDYVVINQPLNIWYQTNVSPDTIRAYQPNYEDAIHRIKFTNSALTDVMYNQLSILKSSIVVLSLDLFLKQFNQNSSLPLTFKQNDIYYELDKEPVGRLLSELDIELYEHFFKLYETNKTSAHVQPIDLTAISRSGISFQELLDNPIESLSDIKAFKVPLQDGYNVISINEYTKKRNAYAVAKLSACIWRDSGAIRIAICYRDDTIEAVSIQPCQLWFPQTKAEK